MNATSLLVYPGPTRTHHHPCHGLDGWVGPGRGTDPVDDEAIRACERDVDRILSTIHTDGES